MTTTTALLEHVDIKKSSYGDYEYKVGTFSVSNLKKKAIDDYRNQFIKIVEDNPLLVPAGMTAQDYALQTFSEQTLEILSSREDGTEKKLRISAAIFPEADISNYGSDSVTFDDVERLGNVEVDVELRVGICDTFEGRRVRFIADTLTFRILKKKLVIL